MTRLEQLFDGKLPRLVMFDLDGTLIDSVPDLAAAVDQIRRDVAPVVSLYVNAYNHSARWVYEKVGFVQEDTYATILF